MAGTGVLFTHGARLGSQGSLGRRGSKAGRADPSCSLVHLSPGILLSFSCGLQVSH